MRARGSCFYSCGLRARAQESLARISFRAKPNSCAAVVTIAVRTAPFGNIPDDVRQAVMSVERTSISSEPPRFDGGRLSGGALSEPPSCAGVRAAGARGLWPFALALPHAQPAGILESPGGARLRHPPQKRLQRHRGLPPPRVRRRRHDRAHSSALPAAGARLTPAISWRQLFHNRKPSNPRARVRSFNSSSGD
jgi:hypothetical protein